VLRSRRRVLAVGLAGLLLAVGTAQATHTPPDTLGHTTVEQRVDGGDPSTGYQQLGVVAGEDYLVRDPLGVAQEGRETRRESLAYFSQMTDFQLADEESPARVEFLDPGPSSAWRPQEAFTPFQLEATVNQINAFAHNSPFPGSDAQMGFALLTGDQADNNQRNETIWIRELLEGGENLMFDSGIDPTNYDLTLPGCAQAQLLSNLPRLKAEADAHNYTGVQDYDDYDEPTVAPLYYDPDEPRGQYAEWPTYPGLMDRAQQIVFPATGLDVPFFITNGNHDVLVQGNEDANQEFERIALGCEKVLASTAEPGPGLLDPSLLLSPSASMLVPPDPQRQFLSKIQIKQIYGDCEAADPQDIAALEQCLENDADKAHGFAFVDPAEVEASNGSASYYAWDPPEMPGFRFISIDTNSEGGQTAEGVACGSSNGNIDDPQFQWLESELQAAQAANKLIVLFGHHPIRSMCAEIADEQAVPCGAPDDGHGHPFNPGCDADPRLSVPIHLGEDPQPGDPRVSLVELLDQYPNAIAYVPGHTHEHRLTPFTRSDGSVWWELNTSAVIDHPTQSRLVEVFDNNDGTLSIFTNVIDHASAATAPPSGTPGANFGVDELASVGRTFTYNDPQNDFSGEGRGPQDRNVELLVADPRDGVDAVLSPPGDGPEGPCANAIRGSTKKDNLRGTDGGETIKGRRGNDRIKGFGGDDCLKGNGGRDRVKGGGDDDKIVGGKGRDKLKGGPGKDKLKARGGGRDLVRCGKGKDKAVVDRRDKVRGCEKVRRGGKGRAD
jgi:hypothetical protein